MISIAKIIFVVSCQNTLILFEAIALSENNRSDLLITKLGISRKQYYSSIEKLMHTGLVGRISGRYRLTSLGKVLFSCILKINTAIKYYWKLKAIDSIINVISPNNGELPAEEYRAIILVTVHLNTEEEYIIIHNCSTFHLGGGKETPRCFSY